MTGALPVNAGISLSTNPVPLALDTGVLIEG